MFSCSWFNSVKYFDNDQLLQHDIQTIEFLGFSFRDDVVAVDCGHRVPFQGSDKLGEIPLVLHILHL